MSKSNLSAIFGDSSDSDSDDDVASGSSSTSGGDAGKVAAVEEKKRAAAPAAPAGGLPSVASLIFSDDSDDSDSDDEDDNANLGAGMSNLKPASSRAGRAKAAAKQRKRGGGGTRAAASASAIIDSGDSYDEEESDSSGDEDDKAFIVQDKNDRHGNSESRHFKGKDERPDWDQEDRKKRSGGGRGKAKTVLDKAMERLKRPQHKTKLGAAQIQGQAQEFVNKMNSAAYSDDKAAKNGKLPMYKLGMLKEVESMMLKRGMREYLINANICEAIVKWLKWGKDGSLPTLAIRSKLFLLVEPFPIENVHLRESGIGKMFNFYSKHPEENSKNKALLRRMIEKWANENVFGKQKRSSKQRRPATSQKSQQFFSKPSVEQVAVAVEKKKAVVEGGGEGEDGNDGDADGSETASGEVAAAAGVAGAAGAAAVDSGAPDMAADAPDDASSAASAAASSKARKRTRLDLDRNRDKRKRKKTEPILSGNQYARSIPEALSYDFTMGVASQPVDEKLVVQRSQLEKKRDANVSKKAELKKMFGNSGTGKASRAVNMSITGRD